ncbi:hypothetical protein DXG01_014626 [Tephrocybe rancida]|nr:hypothetical protein DXG01_014626 [Tephrocybe rancida]
MILRARYFELAVGYIELIVVIQFTRRALKHDRNIAAIATIVGVAGPKKRNPFLDLKAEEDTWDGADILDEVDTDSEFDDFIDDQEVFDKEPPMVNPLEEDEGLDVFLDDDEEQFPDNEHPPSARATSHMCLPNHNNMEQWQSLLACAHEWGHTHKLSGPSTEELKPLPPAMLYRVRVKEGYEETAAMVVGNKLLTAGTAWVPSIKSIIRRVSCPSWIFVESSNSAEVNKLCANLSDIYLREIHPIIKDLKQYLQEPFVAPKPGDCVCLNSPPLYRGDLAYVTCYNEPFWMEGEDTSNCHNQGANVLIVLRVEHFVNRTKGKGRAGRPSKLILNVREAIHLFGAHAVIVKSPSNFIYQGDKFHEGFLYLTTHDFEPTVPMFEELVLFQRCDTVNHQDIVRAQTEIALLRLKVDNRVVVTSGELVGMTAVVTSLSEDTNEATVSIDTKEGIMDVMVSPIHLRKAF